MGISDLGDPEYPHFRLYAPAEQRVPYVFNSPHSGRAYPESLLQATSLKGLDIRRSEDVLVDDLFSTVVRIGAPLLAAQFPRAWLDVNREPYELDPKLFSERLPGHANIRSMRVAGGLGTVPRLVAENLPIYKTRPTLSEAMERIEGVYRPYHAQLTQLMVSAVGQFGYAVLVDCHSMPSNGAKTDGNIRPDIIVGDRYGTSCNGEISRELIRSFSDLGYTVTRNKPYAGGFITEHYGRPHKGLHAVQIEVNRALYLDEKSLQPTAGYSALKQDIEKVMQRLVSLPDGQFSAVAQAAE